MADFVTKNLNRSYFSRRMRDMVPNSSGTKDKEWEKIRKSEEENERQIAMYKASARKSSPRELVSPNINPLEVAIGHTNRQFLELRQSSHRTRAVTTRPKSLRMQ